MKKEARVHRLPTEDKSGIILKKEGKLEWNPNGNPIYGLNHLGWKYQHLYVTTDEAPNVGDSVLVDIYPHGNPEWKLAKVVSVYESVVEVDLGWSTTQTKPIVVCKKIIATTDPKLHTNEIVEEDMHMYKKSLPQIPQSFTEEYCKAGGIDEVLVSVDSYLNIPVGTSVKFNDRLPSTLKEYEGLDGRVIWGVEDRLDVGNNCIKVEFLNKYNNVCNLNASVCHWYKSIKHLYYNKVAIDSNNCIIIHPVEEKMYTEEQRKDIIELVKSAFYNGIAHERGSKMDIDKWIEENL